MNEEKYEIDQIHTAANRLFSLICDALLLEGAGELPSLF
jgi:hypothetical protein